jgi:hypothetical protein
MATGASPLEGALGAIFTQFPARAMRCTDSSAKVLQVFTLFGQSPKYLNVWDKSRSLFWFWKGNPFTRDGTHRAVIVSGRVYDALTGPKGLPLADYANLLRSLGIEPLFR